MSQLTIYNCDYCESDLTTTLIYQAYRIVVSSQIIRQDKNNISFTEPPPLDPYPIEKHFCNNACLLAHLGENKQ